MPHKLLFGLAAAQTGTQSFNTVGTFSWTAPTGVTSVTVTGRGGSNDTAWTSVSSYFYLTVGPYVNPSFTTSDGKTYLGSSLTYEAIKSQAATNLTQWTGITTDTAGEDVTANIHEYYYFTGEGWFRDIGTYSRKYRRTGTVASAGNLFTNSGTIPTDGSASSFAAQSYATNLEAEYIQYGTASTALGETFAAGGDAVTVTNVAVTAGQSYPIVVGSNESFNVSFIQISW